MEVTQEFRDEAFEKALRVFVKRDPTLILPDDEVSITRDTFSYSINIYGNLCIPKNDVLEVADKDKEINPNKRGRVHPIIASAVRIYKDNPRVKDEKRIRKYSWHA